MLFLLWLSPLSSSTAAAAADSSDPVSGDAAYTEAGTDVVSRNIASKIAISCLVIFFTIVLLSALPRAMLMISSEIGCFAKNLSVSGRAALSEVPGPDSRSCTEVKPMLAQYDYIELLQIS